MFYLISVTLLAWMAIETYARGPRVGLWRGWLTALLLLPSWIAVQLGALTLDLRTVAGLTGLVGLWLFRGHRHCNRWLVADLLVAALILVQVLSEYHAGSAGNLTTMEVIRKWLLPYLVGRWFLGSAEDVRRVLPFLVKAIALLSLYALVEAVTQVNPLNELLGRVYRLLEEGQGYRWGLKRAQAFLDHPIYLGYLLVLVFPWVLEARRQAARGEGPRWWKLVPFLVAGALVCTASRGPLIAAVLTVFVPVVVARPRWRIPALALAVVAAGGTLLFKDAVVDGLARWAGEQQDEVATLLIGGQETEYTGTSHRLLLFQVYDEALAQLGPFGYGSELQGIDWDDAPSRFRSIDNHYVLFVMQYGYLALGLFLLLALVTLVNLGRTAWDTGSPLSGFVASLLAAMAMVTVMLFSVWFAPDFGSAWLFCAGLAANLQSLRHNRHLPGSSGRGWFPATPLCVARYKVRTKGE